MHHFPLASLLKVLIGKSEKKDMKSFWLHWRLSSIWRLLSAEIAGLATELGATDRLFPQGSKNMFASLARSIAGQQLATAAAFKIHSRFVEICKVPIPSSFLLFYWLEGIILTGVLGCKYPSSYVLPC